MFHFIGSMKNGVATANDGSLLKPSMEAGLNVMHARRSPASHGFSRREHNQNIELVGIDTALGRVQCVLLPKYFDDVLSPLKLDGRWWVV